MRWWAVMAHAGRLRMGEGVMTPGEIAYLLLVLGTMAAFAVALVLVSRR